MIFSRPTKAFFAYEQSMLRPNSWPPTRHAAPTLWERAKAMFAVMLEKAGSAARLAQRYCFTRTARREIVARLAPVEKLVRTLLMIDAVTFLLMTPEGARLRRETPYIDPPKPPPPPFTPKPKHSTRIVMPGWQTIAALQPRIDPRVVEREERERREAYARSLADAEALVLDLPGADTPDPNDPATWTCRFPVLRWRFPESEPAAPAKPRQMLLQAFDDDDHFPILREILPPQKSRDPSHDVDGHPGAVALARRIEALARVLANPEPAIRQLARRLAAIRPGMITPPDMLNARASTWWHGKPECWNACNIAEPAFRTYDRARAPRPPEPG